MTTFLENLADGAIDLLPTILEALLILGASIVLARLAGNLLSKVLKRQKADPEITLLLTRLARWSIFAVGLITALQRFFDVTAFLAGLGILGFTVGFALQNIMQNFVAGVILLIQQPFNVSDAIEVADYSGSVLAINMRTTEMRTWDGRIVIIPNSDVLSHTITNFTRAKDRRIDVPVGIAYDSDPEQARRTILEAIRSIPGLLADPAPSVVFSAFGDSAFHLTLYFWLDMEKGDFIAARDMAFTKIKAALEQAGIEMPFPTQTVLLQQKQD
ncbi:MAG: mechanosensitive ion channel [Anaerolineales bacterium]|nr:mechanosensitive ion channel [Anaerolineales bacterium]